MWTAAVVITVTSALRVLQQDLHEGSPINNRHIPRTAILISWSSIFLYFLCNLFIYLERYVWDTEQIVPFIKVWILN